MAQPQHLDQLLDLCLEENSWASELGGFPGMAMFDSLLPEPLNSYGASGLAGAHEAPPAALLPSPSAIDQELARLVTVLAPSAAPPPPPPLFHAPHYQQGLSHPPGAATAAASPLSHPPPLTRPSPFRHAAAASAVQPTPAAYGSALQCLLAVSLGDGAPVEPPTLNSITEGVLSRWQLPETLTPQQIGTLMEEHRRLDQWWGSRFNTVEDLHHRGTALLGPCATRDAEQAASPLYRMQLRAQGLANAIKCLANDYVSSGRTTGGTVGGTAGATSSSAAAAAPEAALTIPYGGDGCGARVASPEAAAAAAAAAAAVVATATANGTLTGAATGRRPVREFAVEEDEEDDMGAGHSHRDDEGLPPSRAAQLHWRNVAQRYQGDAKAVLREWLFDHFDAPYPSGGDRAMLAAATGLGSAQINNWFINARVRIWKPLVADIGQELMEQGPITSLVCMGAQQRPATSRQQQAAAAKAGSPTASGKVQKKQLRRRQVTADGFADAAAARAGSMDMAMVVFGGMETGH